MSEHDPVRWLEAGSDAPAHMRGALDAARGARPAPEQLTALAGRLTATLGVPVAPGPVAPPAPWWAAPAVKLASVVLLVGGAAAVGAGAGAGVGAPRAAEVGLEAHAAAVSEVSARATAPADAIDGAGAAPTPSPAATAGAGPAAPGAARPSSGGATSAPAASAPAEPSAPVVSASAPAPAPTLGDEMAMLDRAQQALQPRPADALAIAEEHAQRFAGGKLAEEREVIAVGALVRLGRRAEAEARVERFERRFPGSAYATRIRHLVTE